jgi:hypothetical protein
VKGLKYTVALGGRLFRYGSARGDIVEKALVETCDAGVGKNVKLTPPIFMPLKFLSN